MNLSVVIPAHNEEEGVRPTVERLYGTLMQASIPFEILVVNDHSTDHTEQVLQHLAHELPGVRYVNNLKPGGFGRAIQTGLERFRGDAVCIVMADASDDPNDVVTYYHKLEEGYECVFGSRFLRESRVVDYPTHKLLINRMANWFINVLFQLHFNDTTNAFKAYRREVIDGVKPFLSSHFNITVELPLKAITRGYTYATVPINWYNRATGVSKLKIKEMGSRYLFIVLYVWLERLLSQGDYKRKNAPLQVGDAQPSASNSMGIMALDGGAADIDPTVPRMRQIQTSSDGQGAPGGVATQAPPRTTAAASLVRSTPAVVDQSTEMAATLLAQPAPWVMMLIVAVVAWALIISRRPDALFNAQFWAEDGIWFSQAYNFGALPALLIPNVGYLSMIPRLASALALLFPLLYAPLIFNILAILLQASPAVFLFSGRFDEIIPSRSVKLLLALLYVALPNSYEVNATITNSQWHVGVLACMIVAAAIPKSVGAKIFDVVILLLGGLSGPFCVALVPVLVLRWIIDRRGHTIVLFVANALTIGVQGVTYYLSSATLHRVKAPLGASPLALARLLAGQVFIGATLGMNQYERIFAKTWWSSNKLVIVIALLGLSLIALALWKGPNALRLMVVYGGSVYGLCLISPLSVGSVPAWVQMTYPGAGARYEYIPMVAFVTVLVWLVCQRQWAIRAAGIAALAAMLLIGVPSDWQFPAYANLNYGSYVAQFEQAPSGTDFTFPTNPNWSYILHKH